MSFVIGFVIGVVVWVLRCNKKKMKVDPYETAIFALIFGVVFMVLTLLHFIPDYLIIIPMGIAALFGILWLFGIGFKK